MRLPAAHGGAPMLLAGDFNPGSAGKKARIGSGGGEPSLYAELVEPMERAYDSESTNIGLKNSMPPIESLR